MKGTEKQIKWAEDLKAKTMQAIAEEKWMGSAMNLDEARASKLANWIGTAADPVAKVCAELARMADAKDSASWWINRRGVAVERLFSELIDAL